MENNRIQKHGLRRLLLDIISIFAILIAVLFVFVEIKTYRPNSDALKYFAGDAEIQVTTKNNYYNFHNTFQSSKNAVIFYPGGLVDPKSYIRFCYEIAKKGNDCFIAIMPLNLAVFKINAADQIIQDYPDVTKWVIGGHSLGGVMACRYVNSQTNDKIVGIYYLASYCDQKIKSSTIKNVSIMGTSDLVLDKKAYEASKSNLGANAVFLDIKGGNHSQFGDYGLQAGDAVASITTEEQIQQTVDVIVSNLGK